MTKKYRNWQGIVGVVGLLALSAGLTACGKGGVQLVQDVKLQTYEKADGAYVEVRALLETLNLNFGGQLPLTDPRKPGISYGTIALNPSLSTAGSELVVSVNLSRMRFGTSVDGRFLPNGAPIPVSTGNTPILALRAGDKSIVYLAFDGQTAMVGAALSIKEFDSVSKYAPGLNFFPGFDLGKGVRGLAGIFTGAQTMQSGIALFVDAASVLLPKPQQPGVLSLASEARFQTEGGGSSGLTFHSQSVSNSTQTKAYSALVRLGNQGKRIKLK